VATNYYRLSVITMTLYCVISEIKRDNGPKLRFLPRDAMQARPLSSRVVVLVLVLVVKEKSLVVSLFLVFFRGIYKVVFCETCFQTHITCEILLTVCGKILLIVCGKIPFHFSQVCCINWSAWDVHTDVTAFAQVLVLVLVLGTQVLVLVLGEKSLLTTLSAVMRCLSVRLSRSWILSKRVIIFNFSYRRVAKPF